MAAQPSFPFASALRPAKPVLKWAGGKARLLPTLRRLVPSSYSRYIEPFVGGGAFFFSLAPAIAVINDLNPELIQCYEVVRDAPDSLLHALSTMRVGASEFYELRAIDPTELEPVARAARFIYLNKTCFNGLYRVNKKGRFNSPFGGYTSVALADEDNLCACSEALRRATVSCGDYREVLGNVHKGDFIYLDPPYVPVGKYSDFNRYTAEPFSGANQGELADLFAEMDRKGCFVLLSNSKHPVVEKLYSAYRQLTVKMPRFVNCKGDKRGDVDELIVTNYELPSEFS